VVEHDIFLSYSWRNLALAVALATELEQHGLRVFRDEPGLDDFDEIAPEIEAALRASRSLVALYTPAFPQSRYCQWELYTALSLAYDLDGHTRRIMAVPHGVGYADIRPGRLASLRLPSPAASIAAVADSVAANLRRIDGRRLGEGVLHPRPEWYPYSTEPARRFRGRTVELWELHDQLVVADSAERAGAEVVRVVGLGGVGKTTLVEEYARRFPQDHPGGVFVLRAMGSLRGPGAGDAVLRAWRDHQVAAIAVQLGVDARSAEALRRHLQHDGRPYLWIVDDLPPGVDPATFRYLLAPTAAGRTVMTCRQADEDLGGAVVRLDVLDARASVELLTSRRSPAPGERRVVRELANEDLGGHPQALDLAAALAAEPEFAGYADLRAVLRSPGRDALQLAAELRGQLPGGHQASIAATLLRSIERVGAEGREVLRVLSLLATAPVPEPLLHDVLVRSVVEVGLADTARRSLVKRMSSTMWAVHAMVIRTVRFADPATSHRADLHAALLRCLTERLDAAREAMRFRPISVYLPHVVETASLAEGVDAHHAGQEAGRAYVELGDHVEALEVYETLYARCRDELGEHDLTTLAVLMALAVVVGLHGRHRQALELKTRAHEGLAAALGPDHPDAVTALNNVAVTLQDLHEPERARTLFAAVYRRRRELLGGHDTETIIALGNLAGATAATGRHRLAGRLRQIAYHRLQRLRGASDVLTLEALNNLGSSRRALGDRPGAARAFAEVVRGRREVLGETHPQSLAALANLATVTEGAQASLLLDEAYRGLVLDHEPGSPITLRVLRNLLIARGGQQRPSGPAAVGEPAVEIPAELDPTALEDFDANTDWRLDLFLRAEAVHADLVERLGAEDPVTMVALCHVAHAAAVLGQLDQQLDAANVFIADAVEGLRERLGANHPDTLLAERLQGWIVDQMDDRATG
jgi:tetratricopeptide (TPR) repeat protein